jgi:hypothetical protein
MTSLNAWKNFLLDFEEVGKSLGDKIMTSRGTSNRARRRHSTVSTYADACRNGITEGLNEQVLEETSFIEYASQRSGASGQHDVTDSFWPPLSTTTEKATSRRFPRRHSSFESIQANKAYKEHQSTQDFLHALDHQENHARTISVQSLIDFNVSVNLASAAVAHNAATNESAGNRFSCPVLSYMDDDGEINGDVKKIVGKSVSRRSSLLSVNEEDREGDDNYPRQYSLEISSGEEDIDDVKEKGPRRRRNSYKILSEKLAVEHPQKVIRSLIDGKPSL